VPIETETLIPVPPFFELFRSIHPEGWVPIETRASRNACTDLLRR